MLLAGSQPNGGRLLFCSVLCHLMYEARSRAEVLGSRSRIVCRIMAGLSAEISAGLSAVIPADLLAELSQASGVDLESRLSAATGGKKSCILLISHTI